MDSDQPQEDMSKIDDFNTFLKDFNAAAKCVLPNTPRGYKEVSVLLMRWEDDDDLGTQAEISELEDVFRKLYHFKTTQFLIPSSKSSMALERRLFQWREDDDEDGQNLLVLYYGGHGKLGMEWRPPRSSIWFANQGPNSPMLNWTDLQPVILRAQSDFLMILDCCHAAAGTKVDGSKEGLWASNSLAKTPGVNADSFTRNLIQCLQDLHGTRFNTIILHQHLMVRYKKREPPTLLPCYSFLGSGICASAELTARDAVISISNQAITLPGSETLVLLGVKLRAIDSIPDATSWANWLHDNAPIEVDSVVALCRREVADIIGLQGIYESTSMLIVITIPLCFWNRLPKREAYNFLSHVMSTNLFKANG